MTDDTAAERVRPDPALVDAVTARMAAAFPEWDEDNPFTPLRGVVFAVLYHERNAT